MPTSGIRIWDDDARRAAWVARRVTVCAASVRRRGKLYGMSADDSGSCYERWTGSHDALVRSYRDWCALEDGCPTDTPEGRAWEGVRELIARDPDAAAAALRAVAASLTSEDKQALCSLGADALEDLLKSDPAKFLPVFERAAVEDERVAIAMSCVWMAEPWRTRLLDLRTRTHQPFGG